MQRPFLPFDRARPHHGPEDGGPSVCRRGRQTLVAPPPAGRPPRSLTVLVRGPWPHGDSRVEVRGFSGWGDGRAPASTETHAVHPGQHSDAPDVTVGVTSTTLTGESTARQQPEQNACFWGREQSARPTVRTLFVGCIGHRACHQSATSQRVRSFPHRLPGVSPCPELGHPQRRCSANLHEETPRHRLEGRGRRTAPAQGTAFGGVAPRRSPLCAGSEPASSAEAMTSGNMCPLSTDVPQGRVLTTFPPSKLLTGVLVRLSSTFTTPWPAKRACPLTVPSPL